MLLLQSYNTIRGIPHCSRQKIKERTMKKFNAYFYSFYFYFASNCKAGSCV